MFPELRKQTVTDRRAGGSSAPGSRSAPLRSGPVRSGGFIPQGREVKNKVKADENVDVCRPMQGEGEDESQESPAAAERKKYERKNKRWRK